MIRVVLACAIVALSGPAAAQRTDSCRIEAGRPVCHSPYGIEIALPELDRALVLLSAGLQLLGCHDRPLRHDTLDDLTGAAACANATLGQAAETGLAIGDGFLRIEDAVRIAGLVQDGLTKRTDALAALGLDPAMPVPVPVSAPGKPEADAPAAQAMADPIGDPAGRDLALALYLAWAFAGDDGALDFRQEEGHWRFLHNRLAEVVPGAIGQDVAVQQDATICEPARDGLQTCTMTFDMRWVLAGPSAGAFTARPLQVTFRAEGSGGLRVTRVCEVFIEQCSEAGLPSGAVAAEIRARLAPGLEASPSAPLPAVDHLDQAAFEPRAIRTGTGALLQVLAVTDAEIGHGFGDQGLRPPLAIRQAFHFHQTAVSEPQAILRLLAEAQEGEPIGLWLIDLGTGAGHRLDVQRRSRAEFDRARAVAGQMSALAEAPVFDTRSFFGLRLELARRGHFEALEDVLAADAEAALTELGPYGELFKLALPGIADVVAEGRYGGLTLIYGLVRLEMLGDCGEPVTGFRQTEAITWQLQDRYGIGHGAPWTESNEWQFLLPERFAAIANAEENLVFSPSWQGPQLRAEIARLTCESPARLALERNLAAFYHRDAPASVLPFAPRPAMRSAGPGALQ